MMHAPHTVSQAVIHALKPIRIIILALRELVRQGHRVQVLQDFVLHQVTVREVGALELVGVVNHLDMRPQFSGHALIVSQALIKQCH